MLHDLSGCRVLLRGMDIVGGGGGAPPPRSPPDDEMTMTKFGWPILANFTPLTVEKEK